MDKRETDIKKIAHYMDCMEYHLNAISDYVGTLRSLGADINTADVCFREGSNESKRPIWKFHIAKGLQAVSEATGEKVTRPRQREGLEIERPFLVYKHLWLWRIGEEDREEEDEKTESENDGQDH